MQVLPPWFAGIIDQPLRPRGHAFMAVFVLILALAVTYPFPLAAADARQGSVMSHRITIRVGDRAFVATLADNPAAAAFSTLLPLSLSMTELNGNEKFAELPSRLPTRASRPPSIRSGDLMLYGAETLVLFYKSFSTTYSYTAIGRIDDPAGLAAALGAGRVAVTFERAGEMP